LRRRPSPGLILSLAALFVAVVLPLAFPAEATPHGSPFVQRAGTRLVLNGQPYWFTGLNIYNANSVDNCWYTMGTGPILDQSLRQMGRAKKAFRAWFFQSLATKNLQRDWSAFDHTLAVARAHGAKVIVTLGNQWADCEPAAGYKDETWYLARYQLPDPGGTVSYRDWVAEIVMRYRNDPTILAWQLLNEAEVKPNINAGCSIGAATILKTFATDVSGLIKSIDQNHLVSLGTIGGGQCGAQGDEYRDVHSVATIDLCEFHDYQPNAPMPGDQWNGLQVRIDQCKAIGKPIFVGEVGIRPIDVPGGTLWHRAFAFEAKFRAQFRAGVVGELAWAWSALGSTLDNYDIGPRDPALVVLGLYARP
jgi:mannan endo-1,4-beta-mannosidase